jgi:hypothetical protein
MANQAKFRINNKSETSIDVQAKRILPDGNSDIEKTIAQYDSKEIDLPSTDVSLVIDIPGVTDTKLYYLKAKSDVDLEILCSRTNANWIIKIVPNELPTGIPTTVNVDLGEDPPE